MSERRAALNSPAVQIAPQIAQQVRLTSYQAVALATPTVALTERWARIFNVQPTSVQKWKRSRRDGGRINIFDKVMEAMTFSWDAGVPLPDAYAGITWQAQRIGRGLVPYGGAVQSEHLLESFALMQAKAGDVSRPRSSATTALASLSSTRRPPGPSSAIASESRRCGNGPPTSSMPSSPQRQRGEAA